MTSPNRVIELSRPRGAPLRIGGHHRLAVIAGPCQMESRAHALETAQALREIARPARHRLIYKTSFDQGEPHLRGAPRGLGLAEALPVAGGDSRDDRAAHHHRRA